MTYDIVLRARRRTRRRVSVLAVVAIAAAVAVVAGVTVVGRQPAKGPARSAADPVSRPSDETRVLPTDLTFTDVAGVRLPVSGQAGPRDTGGGLARGFSHDRAGAVLASVHLLVRVAPQVGPAVFEPTLRTQVVGPAADAMRAQVGRNYDDLRSAARAAYGQPVGRLPAVLRGYQLPAFTLQEAQVRVLTESAGANGAAVRVGCTVTMRWIGTDWALVAPPGGDFNGVVSVVTAADAAAFLPFTKGS